MKYQKLSASIASLLDDFKTHGPIAMLATEGAFPLAGASVGTSPQVNVFVHCKPKARMEEMQGVQFHHDEGKVRTATVSLDNLEALSENAGVTRISAARELKPLLDVASAKTSLPIFRTNNPNCDGRGVIIGIVDSGIDSGHPAFSGRILSIWDQTIAGVGWGTTRYGTVLTGAAMSASSDIIGHGTHVAGIAGGNHSTYGGIAPGADFIIVKTDFQNTSIADGVRYVFDAAAKLNRPAVVNLSLGGHWDAHDGTDDLSAAIDLLTGPGKIVVAAAGNEGGDPIHGKVKIPANKTATIGFTTVPSTSSGASPWVVLNGWYDGGGSCEIGIKTSAGNVTPLQPIISSGPPTKNYSFPTAEIRMTTSPATVTRNGDVQFLVQIRPGQFNSRVQGGNWSLTVKNTGSSAVTLNLWSLVPGGAANVVIQSPAESNDLKIGSPGCAGSVVTVASYTTRNQWVDASGTPRAVGLAVDSISDFSSPGPLRNGSQKPDVTAPGAMIVSALSSKSLPNPSSVVGQGLLVEAGTSMASPFITGLVALLLQQTNNLTPANVKTRLRAASNVPGQAAGHFDPKWGFGLIDAGKL